MDRKTALEIIRIDFLQNGKLTETGLRAFIENRISKKAVNEYIGKPIFSGKV